MKKAFFIITAVLVLLNSNGLPIRVSIDLKVHNGDGWEWLENSNKTVSAYNLNNHGPAVFIGFAGYNVRAEMCQKWVYGVVTQSQFQGIFSKIFAIPGPKDPAYENKYIRNDILAQDANIIRAQIIYIAAHSSGTYVADSFLDYLRPELLKKIRLVILDGGEIALDHKDRVKHKFISAIKRLSTPRPLEGGGQSDTLESWNYRPNKEFYGLNFVSLCADGSQCQTENDIHNYVINPQAGEKDIVPYAGPKYNLDATFPQEFAAELLTHINKDAETGLPVGGLVNAEELWNSWPKYRLSPPNPYLLLHRHIEEMVHALSKYSSLKTQVVGKSVEGRDIYLLTWGKGRTRVLLWSQMHGDEPTGTAALLDIINYLLQNQDCQDIRKIESELTLLMIPMLNPDGAELLKRRNAQGIDINRDALALTTPEARALKSVYDHYRPKVAFNLHNQFAHLEVGRSSLPSAMAIMAPPFDILNSDSPSRTYAKRICVLIYHALQPYIGGHVSRYEEGFNPRAFGDNMTGWGAATIAIEMGSDLGKGQDFLVRLNYFSLLAAFFAIAEGTVEAVDESLYDAIEPNKSEARFDWIIKRATVVGGNRMAPFQTDIALNYFFKRENVNGVKKAYYVADLGDLSVFNADTLTDGGELVVSPSDLALGPPQGKLEESGQNVFIYKRKKRSEAIEISNLEIGGIIRAGILIDYGLDLERKK